MPPMPLQHQGHNERRLQEIKKVHMSESNLTLRL
jgi:hypothetical protein